MLSVCQDRRPFFVNKPHAISIPFYPQIVDSGRDLVGVLFVAQPAAVAAPVLPAAAFQFCNFMSTLIASPNRRRYAYRTPDVGVSIICLWGADCRTSLVVPGHRLICQGPWLSWLERSVHIRKVTGSSPVGPISPETLAGTFKEPGKTLGFSGFFFGLTPAFDLFPRLWGYWWVRQYSHRPRVLADPGYRFRRPPIRAPCPCRILSADLGSLDG